MPAEQNTISLSGATPVEVTAGLINEALPPCDERGGRIRLGGSPVVTFQTKESAGTPGGTQAFFLWGEVTCVTANGASWGVRVDITRGARVTVPFAGKISARAIMRGVGGPVYTVTAFLEWFANPSGVQCLYSADDPAILGAELIIPDSASVNFSTALEVPQCAQSVYLVGSDPDLVRTCDVKLTQYDGRSKYVWDNANDEMPIVAGVKYVQWRSSGAAFTAVPVFVLVTA